MAGRRTLIAGAALVLTVGPSALGTAAASARPARTHSVSNRALSLHRSENRWHLRQMNGHHVIFGRANGQLHRRYPFAAPVADRAVGGTHMAHGMMGWADGELLRFHERWAAR